MSTDTDVENVPVNYKPITIDRNESGNPISVSIRNDVTNLVSFGCPQMCIYNKNVQWNDFHVDLDINEYGEPVTDTIESGIHISALTESENPNSTTKGTPVWYDKGINVRFGNAYVYKDAGGQEFCVNCVELRHLSSMTIDEIEYTGGIDYVCHEIYITNPFDSTNGYPIYFTINVYATDTTKAGTHGFITTNAILQNVTCTDPDKPKEIANKKYVDDHVAGSPDYANALVISSFTSKSNNGSLTYTEYSWSPTKNGFVIISSDVSDSAIRIEILISDDTTIGTGNSICLLTDSSCVSNATIPIASGDVLKIRIYGAGNSITFVSTFTISNGKPTIISGTSGNYMFVRFIPAK